jgi:hypothetical protein
VLAAVSSGKASLAISLRRADLSKGPAPARALVVYSGSWTGVCVMKLPSNLAEISLRIHAASEIFSPGHDDDAQFVPV